ncbi:hypothetical protein [Mycobacteroides chelonae]|uniref:Uncharacterized protein n=1 Tax=Mycobacteroides chelonae TaxID=1774 RepID=A0A1S1M933_MYCCH|nr:hypothetical protein [Mycobacteroides chelonae]OHU79780.1 hypothetical protein BKG84_16700 [Mycobacteroides chelonae]
MLNPQFIGRVALPIFAAVLPFNSNGPGLAVSRSWALFWVSLAALTSVQGFFYAELRDQCPVRGPIIAIDAVLEWLIAPVVLVAVAGGALRRTWIAARRKGKAPGV